MILLMTFACHTKIGPTKFVRLDKTGPQTTFASKTGPARLILAAKIGSILQQPVPHGD